MDYLDMVNSVLRRLREDTVSSLYENRQSSVVAEFVNDAKRVVEDAHDWSALRTDLTFATGDGISEYPLPGSMNRATIIDARDQTNQAMLNETTSAWLRRQSLTNNPGTTRPSRYAMEGVDSSGDSIIKLWPTPDSAYIIKVHCVVRTPELSAEGDTPSIPTQPIILLAHALAAQERGDVDSGDLQSLFGYARKSLADAVMYDAAKNRDEQIWYQPMRDAY